MKRKELEEMGLTSEQVNKVMEQNGRDVEAAKGELATITKERDDLKKDVETRDKQIDDLQKSAKGNEELQKQIEDLQKENRATKVNAAIEKALTGAKAKNLTAVKALLKDLDKAELLEDGTIKGLAEQIKGLQTADDTKFLFEAETKKKPDIKGASPADPGDDKPKGITKEQFNRMGYKDRLKLFNEDRETYDLLSGNTTE